MSRDVVIENPVINSAFCEPSRHFEFDEDGITDTIVEARRLSAYFVPIAQPKKKGKQFIFDTEWTQDRVQENKFINDIRSRVLDWRAGGHVGVTRTMSSPRDNLICGKAKLPALEKVLSQLVED